LFSSVCLVLALSIVGEDFLRTKMPSAIYLS
jgi:hypothetical protein